MSFLQRFELYRGINDDTKTSLDDVDWIAESSTTPDEYRTILILGIEKYFNLCHLKLNDSSYPNNNYMINEKKLFDRIRIMEQQLEEKINHARVDQIIDIDGDSCNDDDNSDDDVLSNVVSPKLMENENHEWNCNYQNNPCTILGTGQQPEIGCSEKKYQQMQYRLIVY